MKKVEIILRAAKFKDVKQALDEIGVHFFIFYDVKGYGKVKENEQTYRGQTYDDGVIRRVKIELVLDASAVEQVVQCVLDHGATGEVGDGKIFVYDLEQVYRIRTGETGNHAL